MAASFAGDASYTLSNATNSLNISPKPVTVTSTAGQSKVYGQNDPTAFAYTTTALVGTETLSGSLTRVAGSNVGTYAINQGTVTNANNTNYDITFVPASFAITAKTLTPAIVAASKAYDGTATATLNSQTVTGMVNNEQVGLAVTAATFDTKNVGTGKTVTATGLSLTGAAASNYVLAANATATSLADITAKSVTVTADANQSKVYGQTDPTYTYSGTLLGTDTFTGALSRVAGSNVGSYAYTLGTLSAGSNYSLSLASGSTFAITKATPTVLATGGSFTYDANAHAGSYMATGVGTPAENLTASLSYAGVSPTVYPASATAPTNAGTYTVTATYTASANYNGASDSKALTINRANPSLTATAATNLTYNATAKDGSYTLIGVGTDLSSATATLSYSGTGSTTYGPSATAPANAGTYSVTASFAGNTNYNAATTAATAFAIGKATPTVIVVVGGPYTYSNTAKAVSNATVTGVDGASLGNATVVYQQNGSAVSPVNAGAYDVYASYAGNANYNSASDNSKQLVIGKAALSVTADDKSRTYGDANPAFTASYSGFVNGETLATSGVSGAPAVSTTATTASSVGAYPITASAGTLAAANYSFTYTNGTLTINKATPVVTWNNPANITYGTALSATQLNATATVAGTFTYTPAADTKLPAGAGQNLSASFVPMDRTNYTSPIGTSTVINVDKAVLTITADNKIKNYDGLVYSGFTYTPSGFVNGDNSNVIGGSISYAGAATTATNASTTPYLLSPVVTALTAANYSFAPADGSLTINKASATITLSNLTQTYDGSAKTVTATTNPVGLTGVALTYDAASTAPTNAGSYAVLAALTDANYQASDATGTLVINKADQTITVGTPAPASATYNTTFTVAATASSGLPVSYGSTTPLSNAAASYRMNSGTGTGTVTYSQAGDNNYNAAPDVTVNVSATKANATINVPDYSVTYDGQVHAASGQASGINSATQASVDLSNLLSYGAGVTNVPGGSATWSFAGDNNYNSASGSATVGITQATPTIALTVGGPYLYDGNQHGVSSATVTGVGGASLGNASVAYQQNNALATPLNAGLYDVTASFAGNSNYAAAAPQTGTLTINKADATVNITPYSGTYDGAAHSLTGTATGVSGESLNNSLSFGTSFTNVPGGTATWTFTGGTNYKDKTSTAAVAISKATPTVALNLAPSYTYTGSAQPVTGTVTGVQNTSLGAANVTYKAAGASSFGTTAPVTVGIYDVKGAFDGDGNYNPAETQGSMSIGKAVATVTLGSLNPTYDGLAKAATATTSATGTSTYTFTYDGSTTAPTNAGSYAVVATLNNDNFSGSANGTLVIAQASNAITFGPLGDKTFGDASFNLTASATSGDNVVFTVAGGPATISGNTLTITGAGNVTVTASEAGNANYVAAAPVQQTFTVAPATPIVTWAPLSAINYGTSLAGLLNATATFAGSPVQGSFEYKQDATVVTDATVLDANSSAYPLRVTFTPSSSNYGSAGMDNALTVRKVDQHISWSAPTAITYGAALSGTQLNATVTGVNGGSAPGTLTYTPAAATVLRAGTHTLSVTAAATTNYNEATTTVDLQVMPAAQTITFTALGNKTYGDADFTVSASTTSPLPITFSATGAATVSGNTVQITGAGQATITATQAGDNDYQAATSVSQSFTIDKAVAQLNITGLTHVFNGTAKGATVTTVPTGLSTVNVTYNGSATLPINAGSYTVDASLTNDNYVGSATAKLEIAKASQTITVVTPAPNTAVYNTNFTVAASASSGLPVSYGSTGKLTNTGATYTMTSGTGSGKVTYSQGGDDNYEPATMVEATVAATKASATLALVQDDLQQTYNGSARTVGTTTNPDGLSGVSVNYSPVASPTDAGTYQVTASLSNDDYAATDATGTLHIDQAGVTVTVSGFSGAYNGLPHGATAYSAIGATGLKLMSAVTLDYTGTPNGTAPNSYHSTVAPTDAGDYIVTATYPGSTNYATANNSANITIGKANQAITWTDPAAIFYGTALSGRQLNARTSGDGALTYSPVAGTVLSAGPQSLSVNAAATNNYNAANASVHLTVNHAQLVITANSRSKIYGDDVTFTGTEFTSSGLVNGNSVTSVTLTSTGAPASAAYSATGYAIVPSAAVGTGLENYDIAYADGLLSMHQKSLTIAATNRSKVYGTAYPLGATITAADFTATGLVNGNTVTGVTLASAGEAAAAGVNTPGYAITPSMAVGSGLDNYDIAYQASGKLEVTKAALSVVAADKAKTYGQPNPTLTGTLTGVMNNDLITEAYSTSATATSGVGPYAIVADVNATSDVLANYTLTKTNATLTINKALLTYAATAVTRTYGTTNPALAGTVTGFVANDTQASATTGTLAFTTTATSASNVGSYAITGSGLSAANYNFCQAPHNATAFTITKATPVLTWNNPADITYGTALSATQLNATAANASTPVVGVFTYSPAAGAKLSAGAGQTMSVNFLPTDLANYNTPATAYATINVNKATLTVTAGNRMKTYGDVLTLGTSAFTTSGLVYNDAVNSVVLTSTGAAVTAAVGSYDVEPSAASGTGLSNYTVNYVNGTLAVGRKGLTITASNRTKTYGDAVTFAGTEFTTPVGALVNGDVISNVTLASAGAAATVSVGTSPIMASAAIGTGLDNYIINYVDGTLTIGQKGLTITAGNRTKIYGDALTLGNSAFIPVGLVNGDVVASVALTSVGTINTASVGSYDIAPSTAVAGTNTITRLATSLGNYAITYVTTGSDAGKLTVTPAMLTVANTNRSKTYGQTLANADYAGTLVGVLNNDGITVTRSSTGSLATSNVGTYDIIGALVDPNNKLGNYTASNPVGTLTVNKAQLTITADNKSKTYDGKVYTAFTYTPSGFVNNETASVISGAVTYTGAATTAIDASATSYTLTPVVTALTATNYSFAPANGTLTIGKAPLTVSADDKGKLYGQANPTFTGTLTGVMNGDNITKAYSTTATVTTGVGTYAIVADVTATPAVLANYNLTKTNGTLTISRQTAELTYTGLESVATSCTTCGAAVLTLSATLRDVAAASSGNITTAKIRFLLDGLPVVNTSSSNGAITDPQGWTTVGLVNSTDTKTGTVLVKKNVDIGAADASNYTLSIEVGGSTAGSGNYTVASTADEASTVINVYKPLNDFITGGGYVAPTASSGSYASDAGRRTNFGFNVRYNKSGKSLQGTINIIFRRTETDAVTGVRTLHTYQIKGNAMTSLTVNSQNALAKTAVFNGKANMQDVTNPLQAVSVVGNMTLQVTMTDRGTPGTNDQIGVTVFDNSGGIFYSSNWATTSTSELYLQGGNLVVNSGTLAARNAITTDSSSTSSPSNTTGNSITQTISEAAADANTTKLGNGTLLELYPNPMAAQGTVHFHTEKGGKAQVYLYNQLGALVATLYNAEVQSGQEYYVPVQTEKLAAGVYLCRLISNGKVENQRINVVK
ncbi:MBG domain-containing protein [Hymenobacter properus]|uniref:T9SS type A sorting domain-containing protein n=1 Tax=Hymenobacter properus TaxID=2791026 RepID=A0A931BH32_9BACT|nr:MBG domain-containing protein [Hymenobacter properus]MBF9143814.1 T9SS type A sorting domain-containing protein [Hymenobacter properus]MBR7722627.1 T9SS type A sorting domain-containing protein [Microvirga sp. SRT04]